jgi:hyperosmotically inducible periplasmic protein
MTRARLIGACLAAALMLPAAGFAADGKAREFVKDSVITTKIKAEMAKEKPSTLVKVSVDTDKTGVVVLSGTAKTQVDKDRAESVARSVKGVTTVENNIEIKL